MELPLTFGGTIRAARKPEQQVDAEPEANGFTMSSYCVNIAHIHTVYPVELAVDNNKKRGLCPKTVGTGSVLYSVSTVHRHLSTTPPRHIPPNPIRRPSTLLTHDASRSGRPILTPARGPPPRELTHAEACHPDDELSCRLLEGGSVPSFPSPCFTFHCDFAP